MDKETVLLNNGVRMPMVGLGVWQMEEGMETEKSVLWAIQAGYRLIDTATLYGNERSVGRVVRESGTPRGDIFVTTKLWPTDFSDPESAFHASLSRLGLQYVDLYLIHWPAPAMERGIWQTLERLYESKLTRAIGVSNYGVRELEELQSYAKIMPAVNQVSFSPFSYKKDVLEYCAAHGIALEAYSPLTRGRKLNNPRLGKIAVAHNKSPAQILIRWCLDHGAIAIPKSSNKQRIKENFDVFDFSLSPEEMQELDFLR
ncbi:MAG: aldo/keto reductase [Patescibacteria group bacterium]|nr:aldo/keto reductase [Patescibacteria group bacterium]